MAVFLNTFTPLAFNKFGRNSASSNNLPWYIDGSCRREPDFQNPFPAITQLCRPKMLVPRLKVGDLVIYLTKLGAYANYPIHWNFICVLEVIDFAHNHNQAEAYYLKNNIPVSQNIICSNTSPFPLNMTHGLSGFPHKNFLPEKVISIWNKGYVCRSIDFPKVAFTKVWEDTLNLRNPPIINHAMMQNIFGRVPSTQTPPMLKSMEWTNFRNALNL